MSLGARFQDAARRFPDKPALICNGKSVTYEQLDRRVTRLAGWLLQQGLQPGDRVAVHWMNSIPAAEAFFACFRAGLIVVPVNARLKSAEVAYVLKHAQPRIYFCQPQLETVAREACVNLTIQPLPCTELPAPSDAGAPLPQVAEDDTALVLYTSGTTARPKGVTHTHRSIFGTAGLMYQLGLAERDTLVLVTSIMHASGVFCQLVPALLCGATVVLIPSFDPAAVLDAAVQHGCTFSGALPAQLQFIVEEQAARPRAIGTLRTFIAGGDCVPVPLQERFRELFGLPVLELLGMTESVPTCSNRGHDIRPGSVGRLLEGVEARVLGLTGYDLADGEIGEMAVRSPANFDGYWNDPVETAVALQDGWVLTGDLVRRDPDGFFWFEGRKKQIIVRGGANIAPQEVEEVLYRHPAVLEVGVVGLPDPRYGERVVAFVSLRAGTLADEQELREFARRQLSDHKVPERIEFLDILPKGPTGKVQRRELKERALKAAAGS